jgi:hypothetical protein
MLQSRANPTSKAASNSQYALLPFSYCAAHAEENQVRNSFEGRLLRHNNPKGDMHEELR